MLNAPLQTLEALKMVLNLSSNKRFNVDILDKVMALLEEQNTHISDTKEDSVSNTSADVHKETRRSNHLLDVIGDILQQVHNISGRHFISSFIPVCSLCLICCVHRLCEVEAATQRYGVCLQDGIKSRVTSWHVLKLC
jgi:hypothetical protein